MSAKRAPSRKEKPPENRLLFRLSMYKNKTHLAALQTTSAAKPAPTLKSITSAYASACPSFCPPYFPPDKQSVRHLLDVTRALLPVLLPVCSICPQVTYLTVAGNELTGEGLDGVRPLRDLTVFNASGNRIKRVPPSVFAQFRALQALVLNNNSIAEVPPTWFKKGLLSLNTLVMSHNQVRTRKYNDVLLNWREMCVCRRTSPVRCLFHALDREPRSKIAEKIAIDEQAHRERRDIGIPDSSTQEQTFREVWKSAGLWS